jgi:hypothetical protein
VKIPIDELRFLEREKGIALETVIGALESALAAAYKRQPNAPEARGWWWTASPAT